MTATGTPSTSTPQHQERSLSAPTYSSWLSAASSCLHWPTSYLSPLLPATHPTADPDVVRDICSSLHVDHETGVLCQPWRRPNLRLRVELVGGEGFKRQRLLEVLNS